MKMRLLSSTASQSTCCSHLRAKAFTQSCDSLCSTAYGLNIRAGLCSGAARLLPRQPFSSQCRAARHARVRCQASSEDSSDASVQDRIKSTLSGLDALLGIDPEEEERKKRKEAEEERVKSEAKRAQESRAAVDISISPDVLEKLRQADEQRAKSTANSDKTSSGDTKQIKSEIEKIVELGKRRAEQESAEKGKETPGKEKEKDNGFFSPDAEKIRKELEWVLMPMEVDRADVEIMKREVFTANTFYITSIVQLTELLSNPQNMKVNPGTPTGGIVVQGTLRMPRETLFDTIQSALRQRFGDKYELFMVPDMSDEGDDPRGGPRVAFQVCRGDLCRPKSANTWQKLVAVILAVLTVGSCLQLGLTSYVSLLPKETLDWLNDPNNQIDPNVLPPGLENFDPVEFLAATLPVSIGVLAIQIAHEVSHRVVAGFRKIKMGTSFLVPNGAIGTFGSVTPFKSMVSKRSDLFDVAVAGPAAAGAIATVLFLSGLAFTAAGQEGLIGIPAEFFKGSLALGSLMQAVLGEKALAGPLVVVHPFAVAGFAGLFGTALNLLPVGSIDGGRIVQGAFGRAALSITSLATYVGLGLGVLGSNLALPFGLYILLVQRDDEKVLLDNVTPPSSSRQIAAAALIFAAILVLLPMASGLSDDIPQSGMFL